MIVGASKMLKQCGFLIPAVHTIGLSQYDHLPPRLLAKTRKVEIEEGGTTHQTWCTYFLVAANCSNPAPGRGIRS